MFTYNGLIQEYTIQESSIAVLFGLIGGNILFFLVVLGACANSFNNFKMRYEVGRQLYRVQFIPAKTIKERSNDLSRNISS